MVLVNWKRRKLTNNDLKGHKIFLLCKKKLMNKEGKIHVLTGIASMCFLRVDASTDMQHDLLGSSRDLT